MSQRKQEPCEGNKGQHQTRDERPCICSFTHRAPSKHQLVSTEDPALSLVLAERKVDSLPPIAQGPECWSIPDSPGGLVTTQIPDPDLDSVDLAGSLRICFSNR